MHRWSELRVFVLGVLTAISAFSCTNEATQGSVSIESFSSTSPYGEAPHSTALEWTLTGSLEGTTCDVDADGDGTVDDSRSPCPAHGSTNHVFANPGEFNPTLCIRRGGTTVASARTTVYANHVAFRPEVVFPDTLAGFQSAEVFPDRILLHFDKMESLPALDAGAVLVAKSPPYYARNVVDVMAQGATVAVQTSAATFENILESGFVGYVDRGETATFPTKQATLAPQGITGTLGQGVTIALPAVALCIPPKRDFCIGELSAGSLWVATQIEEIKLDVAGRVARIRGSTSFSYNLGISLTAGGMLDIPLVDVAGPPLALIPPWLWVTPGFKVTGKLNLTLDQGPVLFDIHGERRIRWTIDSSTPGAKATVYEETSNRVDSVPKLVADGADTVVHGEIELDADVTMTADALIELGAGPYMRTKGELKDRSDGWCWDATSDAGIHLGLSIGYSFFKLDVVDDHFAVGFASLSSCVEPENATVQPPACTIGEACAVTDATSCRTGKTQCTGGTRTCAPADKLADGTVCGTDSTCRSGICTPVCHPTCPAGSTCGASDGCGAKCAGVCSKGQRCDLLALACAPAVTQPKLGLSKTSAGKGDSITLKCDLGTNGFGHHVAFLLLRDQTIGLAQSIGSSNGTATAELTVGDGWYDSPGKSQNITLRCRDDDAPAGSTWLSPPVSLCLKGTCSAAGYVCGPMTEGCGGTVTCGACSAPAASCASPSTLRTYDVPACSTGKCGTAVSHDSPCPNGCNAGACKACPDACSLGNTMCSADGKVQDCKDLGAGCLQWTSGSSCPSGQVCDPQLLTCTGPPDAPGPIAPADGSVAPNPVTLSWSTSPGAYRYNVRVCRDPSLLTLCAGPNGGDNGIEPNPGETTTAVTLAQGNWYWAVRAVRFNDLGGWGPYSTTRSLAVQCTPQCGARVCGLDPVCNTSCGTCSASEDCDSAGACVPKAPNCCVGRVCGLDPICGTSCGTCQSGACDAAVGQCLACEPSAYFCNLSDVRLCAPDGKSSSFFQTCSYGCASGLCKPQCTQDSDCPNGYCASSQCHAKICPDAQLYCNNNSTEVWLCSANGAGGTFVKLCTFGCANGSCNPQCINDAGCAQGQYCSTGQCLTDLCPQGQSFCNTTQERSVCNANGSNSSVIETCAYGCELGTGLCKACPADCTNKCGGSADGCGGTCNSCTAPQICQGQVCVGDPCSPDPCNARGVCSAGVCTCASPYQGAHCEACLPGYAADYPTCSPLCSLGAVQNTLAGTGFSVSSAAATSTGFAVLAARTTNALSIVDAAGVPTTYTTISDSSSYSVGVAYSPADHHLGLVWEGANFQCATDAGALLGSPVSLCGAGSTMCRGVAIAYDGIGNFGVSWVDDRSGTMHPYLRLVNASTCVSAATDMQVSSLTADAPAIAFGATRYGVTFTAGNDVYLSQMSMGGAKVGSDTLVASATPGSSASATIAWGSAASSWAIVYTDRPPGQTWQSLYLRWANETMGPSGTSLLLVGGTSGTLSYARLTSAGPNFGLIWMDQGASKLRFLRFDGAAIPRSPILDVAGAVVGSLAWDGTRFLAAYQPGRTRLVSCP